MMYPRARWGRPLYVSLIILVILVLGYYGHRGANTPGGKTLVVSTPVGNENRLAEWYSSEDFEARYMNMTPEFDISEIPVKQLESMSLTVGYTAVVLYLVNYRRLRELMLSLSYLQNNVPMHPWPIILFYAEDMDDQVLRTEFTFRLYDFLGRGPEARHFVDRLEWIRLVFELPDTISHDRKIVKPVFDFAWPGYHLMCGFFATQIFEHPRLANVTYYMRLDTDSYVLKPLCYDPIELAHTRNRTYGYRSRTDDPAFVTVGLWDFVDDYARAHPEVERTMVANRWEWPAERIRARMSKQTFPTYYNNFEIVKLAPFRRPDVRKWLDEIMRVPERIYKYRWGDAPLRYVTVSMFFDVEHDVEEYCGMQYWHDGPRGEKCQCEDQLAGIGGHPAQV